MLDILNNRKFDLFRANKLNKNINLPIISFSACNFFTVQILQQKYNIPWLIDNFIE